MPTPFFKPGQSGNPGGRPKGLAKMLRSELESMRHEMVKVEKEGGSPSLEVVDGYKAIFRRLWQIAMGGEDKDSIAAIKILYERTDGAPRQVVEVEAATQARAIDWSAVPVAERLELHAAHERMRQLAQVAEAEPDDSVEH